MPATALRIALTFNADDQAWLRVSRTSVPPFWEGHAMPPMTGDVLRIGGRQFAVLGRAWEHDGDGPLLRLFLGGSHAQSDTVFG